MRHENSGFCPMCLAIINRYQGFDNGLRKWFFEFQKTHPAMHTSCAGRGFFDQEACYAKGSSRAHYGQSGHNYNVAMDIFVLQDKDKNIYPQWWFKEVLGPNLPAWIEWYGLPTAQFFELPHIEVRGWRQLVVNGVVKLVEPIPQKIPKLA